MANGCTFFGPKDETGTSCCNQHDRNYVNGNGKLWSDKELLKCQWETGHKFEGVVMYAALSVLGWPLYSKYRLRDKYGWFPKAKD